MGAGQTGGFRVTASGEAAPGGEGDRVRRPTKSRSFPAGDDGDESNSDEDDDAASAGGAGDGEGEGEGGGEVRSCLAAKTNAGLVRKNPWAQGSGATGWLLGDIFDARGRAIKGGKNIFSPVGLVG